MQELNLSNCKTVIGKWSRLISSYLYIFFVFESFNVFFLV